MDLKKEVEEYTSQKVHYDTLGRILRPLLKRAVLQMGLHAEVTARTKELQSFAEKCLRKADRYPRPSLQFTDLCGARVIVDSRDSIPQVCAFIERNFEIDTANSEDVLDRLSEKEFGYRSVHYIVSLRGDILTLLSEMQVEIDVPALGQAVEKLCERRTQDQCEGGLPPGPVFKAEIQLRTLLQHTWAAFAHDRIYKADFQVPKHWQREAHRIAATLEEADEAFARTIRGVESYRNYFGAYMSEKRRKKEITILETSLAYDPKNLRLAHMLARLQISLGMWKDAVGTLEPFVAGFRESSRGKRVAEISARMRDTRKQNPDDLARAEGDLARLRDPVMAAALVDYCLAAWNLAMAPDVPEQNGLAVKERVRRLLVLSMDLNRDSADALSAMADTYADEGTWKEALFWYEKAYLADSREPRALEGFLRAQIYTGVNLGLIDLMRPALLAAIDTCARRAEAGVYLPYAWYDMGLFHLLTGKPGEALCAYARAVTLTEGPDGLLDRVIIRLEGIKAALVEGRDEKAWMLHERLRELSWVILFLKAARYARGGAPEKFIPSPLEDLSCLADRPVFIIAGGCNEEAMKRMEDYGKLFRKAFTGYPGVVFSAGTAWGVGKLVGDLPVEKESRFSYLPPDKDLPEDTRSDRARYTIIEIPDRGFTPLSSIQTWIDLLLAGVRPEDVRVLGINGGVISAFEYRMALALGAKVGVIRESGRAATDICEDPEWKEFKNLLPLPTDLETLKMFVNPPKPTGLIDAMTIETMAKEAHEDFLKNQKKRMREKDRAMADWPDLPQDLQDSNRQQMRHIEAKLAAVRLGVRPAISGDETKPPFQFSDDDVETMAELEHGRWNEERLQAGWKLGPRDHDKKTSPYLVSWKDLPDEIREYDRQAVRNIPKLLKDHGYVVVAAASTMPPPGAC